MAKRHSTLKNVYATCQRCGTDEPLAEMRWQDGMLLCHTNRCVDTAIIGSRDIAVAKAVAINRHELEADPKLTTPIERKNDQLEVLY